MKGKSKGVPLGGGSPSPAGGEANRWPSIEDELAEVQFVRSQGLNEDAETVLLRLHEQYPGHPALARLADEVPDLPRRNGGAVPSNRVAGAEGPSASTKARKNAARRKPAAPIVAKPPTVSNTVSKRSPWAPPPKPASVATGTSRAKAPKKTVRSSAASAKTSSPPVTTHKPAAGVSGPSLTASARSGHPPKGLGTTPSKPPHSSQLEANPAQATTPQPCTLEAKPAQQSRPPSPVAAAPPSAPIEDVGDTLPGGGDGPAIPIPVFPAATSVQTLAIDAPWAVDPIVLDRPAPTVLPLHRRRGAVLAAVGGLLVGIAALSLSLASYGAGHEEPNTEEQGITPAAVAEVDVPKPGAPASPAAASPDMTGPAAATAATSAEDPSPVLAVGATPLPEANEAEDDEPEMSHRRRRRHRRRAKPRPEPTAEPGPQPELEPEANPSPQPKPAPPSAKELLHQAKAAFVRGDHRAAYRLAKRSHDAKESHAALEVMTRCACRLGNDEVARTTLRRLPLSNRRGIRRDCRNSGNRIPL